MVDQFISVSIELFFIFLFVRFKGRVLIVLVL